MSGDQSLASKTHHSSSKLTCVKLAMSQYPAALSEEAEALGDSQYDNCSRHRATRKISFLTYMRLLLLASETTTRQYATCSLKRRLFCQTSARRMMPLLIMMLMHI